MRVFIVSVAETLRNSHNASMVLTPGVAIFSISADGSAVSIPSGEVDAVSILEA